MTDIYTFTFLMTCLFIFIMRGLTRMQGMQRSEGGVGFPAAAIIGSCECLMIYWH